MKLDTDQLIAGALLYGFERLNELDISLLKKDFILNNTDYDLRETNLSKLENYLDLTDGTLSLKESNSATKEYIAQLTGDITTMYFQSFDLSKFMLEKIKNTHNIRSQDFIESLNNIEKEQVVELFKNKYIRNILRPKDLSDEPIMEVKLTIVGEIELFKLNNKNQLDDLINNLELKKYDTKLIDDFLVTQNLNLPSSIILTVDKIEEFCYLYDRYIFDSEYEYINHFKLKRKQLV